MFDYPLPHSRSREYQLLGLSPDASSEEVMDAQNTVATDLQARKAAAKKRLDELSTGSEQADAADERVREARRQLDDLGSQLNLVNGTKLAGAKERSEHDSKHPPAQILKLEDCAPEMMANRRQMLRLLRRAVTAFLEMRTAEVFHPSDLTRVDFTADHTFHPLLDRGDQ
jgi:spore cortex formation protein SpoVR/YcgB (stage V sporulation)